MWLAHLQKLGAVASPRLARGSPHHRAINRAAKKAKRLKLVEKRS
jgi:hypothetical protein